MNTGEEGLNTSEAHDRLERFGRNELEEKVKSKWKVFIGHVRLFPRGFDTFALLPLQRVPFHLPDSSVIINSTRPLIIRDQLLVSSDSPIVSTRRSSLVPCPA